MNKRIKKWISSHRFLRNVLAVSDFHIEAIKMKENMKYLIVGLGNIGPKYENTRHNIGFEVVDALVEKYGESYDSEKYGRISSVKIRNKHLFILKPNTYMNRSGLAVSYWMNKLKVSEDRVLIILDDLNIEFGSLRLKRKGSPGGHNGLKDISQRLGHSNYARLRFGIGNDYHKGQQINFVLGKWTKEETDELIELVPHSLRMIEEFCLAGVDHAMRLNRKA